MIVRFFFVANTIHFQNEMFNEFLGYFSHNTTLHKTMILGTASIVPWNGTKMAYFM